MKQFHKLSLILSTVGTGCCDYRDPIYRSLDRIYTAPQLVRTQIGITDTNDGSDFD